MQYLKAEQIGSAKWRLLAIPFGGPMKGDKDLDREFFTPRTDIKPKWFKERPVLFHHGQDRTIGDEDIGVAEEPIKADDGWWVNMWLDRSNRYWQQVSKLIAAGKMYGSSGTIGHLAKVAPSGEILTWPYAEQSLTPIPSNFQSRLTAAKAFEHFTLAGIELSDTVKSLLEELDRPATADLPSDLSAPGEPQGDLGAGGDDVAMTRRALALGRVLRLERRANS